MRRIFFPLSKTAEPGPKKPHTFKMITPLPYRVRFFCAIQTVNTTPHALVPPLLTPYYPRRFLPATLSAPPPVFTHAVLLTPPYPPPAFYPPPYPHLAIKKPPGQTPKRFIKIHVRLTSVYGFLQLVPVQSVKPALIQKSVFPLHWSFSFTGLVPQSIGTTSV